MTLAGEAAGRLAFLVHDVEREARHLTQTDERLFGPGLGAEEAASLPHQPEWAERVDAFVARLGRLQDTVAQTLLPCVLDALQEPVGTVLDNLNRAERLGSVASFAAWSELRASRIRMVYEYTRNPEDLALALRAACGCSRVRRRSAGACHAGARTGWKDLALTPC